MAFCILFTLVLHCLLVTYFFYLYLNVSKELVHPSRVNFSLSRIKAALLGNSKCTQTSRAAVTGEIVRAAGPPMLSQELLVGGGGGDPCPHRHAGWFPRDKVGLKCLAEATAASRPVLGWRQAA